MRWGDRVGWGDRGIGVGWGMGHWGGMGDRGIGVGWGDRGGGGGVGEKGPWGGGGDVSIIATCMLNNYYIPSNL